MDQDLIKKVADLLHITYSSISNSERQSVENQLYELSVDFSKYFEVLLCIISSSMSMSIKNAAGVQLKKLVKQCMDNNTLVIQNIENWGESIYKTLTQSGLDQSLRTNLGYALLPLLSTDNPESSCVLLSKLFPYILSSMKTSTEALYGALKLIKIIYSGYTFNSFLYDYFLRIMPVLANVIYSIIPNQSDEKWEILEECAGCVLSVIEHYEITARSNLIHIQAIPELSVMFGDLLGLRLQDPNLGCSSLINVATTEAHCSYNKLKSYVLKSIIILVRCLVSYKQKNESVHWEMSPLINLLSDNLQQLLISLNSVLSLSEFEEILQLEYVSDPIDQILLLLAELIPDARFFSYFNSEYRGILMNICMPLLKTSPNDLDMFVENPDEFVASANDLCEKKEFESYKASAAKVLFGICEYIDGALSFIWYMLFEIFNHTVSNTVINETSNLFPYKNSIILNIPNENKLDLILLSYSILNYITIPRLDLTKILESILASNMQYFYASIPLIKNRVCMVIKYYSIVLFFHENQMFYELIKFIINCCKDSNELQAVSIQASETLSYLLQEEDILLRVYNILSDIIQSLIQIIPYQNNKQYYEVLYEIINSNISVITPYIDTLVPNLVLKIADVHRNSYNNKKKDKILIDKCWNIIYVIANSRKVQVNTLLEIESYVLPLFEYMRNPSEIEFDEDILQFEVSIIKKSENVTNAGWGLLGLIPLTQEKHKGSLSLAFPLINSCLHYGKQQFFQNQPGIDLIVSMCEKAFTSPSKPLRETDYSECCLIYQQLFLNFPGQLDDKIEPIIACMISRLNTSTHDYYISKLYGVVFACIIYDLPLSLKALSKTQMSFEYFINSLCEKLPVFTNMYDVKLAALGLCRILEEYVMPLVLKLAIKILSGKNIINKNNELKVKINLKNFNNFDDEEISTNIRISTMLHGLNSLDEYQKFKNLLKSMQNSRPHDFVKLIQSLNREEVDDLTEIIKSQRIQLGGFLDVTEIRKIVKPKQLN
jgi:hypothetical protein